MPERRNASIRRSRASSRRNMAPAASGSTNASWPALPALRPTVHARKENHHAVGSIFRRSPPSSTHRRRSWLGNGPTSWRTEKFLAKLSTNWSLTDPALTVQHGDQTRHKPSISTASRGAPARAGLKPTRSGRRPRSERAASSNAVNPEERARHLHLRSLLQEASKRQLHQTFL